MVRAGVARKETTGDVQAKTDYQRGHSHQIPDLQQFKTFVATQGDATVKEVADVMPCVSSGVDLRNTIVRDLPSCDVGLCKRLRSYVAIHSKKRTADRVTKKEEDNMLHFLYFITRKPSISEAEFHRYWREVHGPIAKKIQQLRGYIQSHRIPFTGMNSVYDGVAEAWVEDAAAMAALRTSPEYLQGALADEPNFIDMSRVEGMVTNDHVILDGPQTPQQVKLIFQLKRKSGWSLADGRKYWIEVHGPIVKQLPGLRRYVQSHLVDAAYNYAEPKWDGVAQLWVDDAAAMQTLLDSKEFKEGAWPDGEKFLDLSIARSLVAQEHRVI